MNIIEIKQNTPEWTEWRKGGLGASDAPIIMGVSPWTSPFELWAQKVGLIQRSAPNEYQQIAMDRGHELEPVARALYEELSGMKYPAVCGEHSDFPFIRSSFDGYNDDFDVITTLEVKCPGKADHATALKGVVPLKYMPQVQLQMAIAGAKSSKYMSFRSKTDYKVITVLEDKQYQVEMIAKMREFWRLIELKTPPPIKYYEIGQVVAMVQQDVDRVNQSFKILSLICEGIAKGEKIK